MTVKKKTKKTNSWFTCLHASFSTLLLSIPETWLKILQKGGRSCIFFSWFFHADQIFSFVFSFIFFFLWLVLQLTRCCGSLPILFPRLLLQGDYPDYLRLCCFQVPRICCTLKVFLFFTYHSDIILHRLPSFSGSNNLAESLQSQYSCSGKAEVTQLHMGQVLHHHSSINYSVRSQNV